MTIAIRTLFDTPEEARMTAEQYLEHPLSERKSDLIEGVFIMASPASFEHEEIQSFLIATLRNFVGAQRVGRVLGPNTAYRLSEANVVQPDVSFISARRLHLAESVYFPGPPDIAVEIISPSSRHYDEIEKKILYARHGVREYWLIDPLSKQATFNLLAEDTWIPVPSEPGILRSQVLEGYWLKLEWLFPLQGQPAPSELEVARLQGLI